MKIDLEFKDSGKDIAASLSAMVRLGDSIFAGGDEGVKFARLEERDGGKRFELEKMIDLNKWLDLPKPTDDPTKKVKEIDLEGMDFDRETNLLWLIGSHSLKRGKAKKGESVSSNLADLKQVKADANRFILASLPVGGTAEKPRIAEDGPKPGEALASQLQGSDSTSALLDAMRRDKDDLFQRFCAPAAGIPGKDNGVDIEGLACAPQGRLLIGLRGPVLRGIAVILEVKPAPARAPGNRAKRLRLEPIGPGGAVYRRHFLDLAGLGIRDLCWQGDDLLVLAGPTASIDAPPQIIRWTNARAAIGHGAGDDEAFVWREPGALVPAGFAVDFQQHEIGFDHAETIAFLDKKRLAVGYDSPSSARLNKPATLKIDVAEA
ncbi:MAG TPA: DUF3616 domain-containing protein [Terriglobia bacterium]|nr:DUF3616 domain-containing protein [Terriglobia bacterium]